MSWHEVKLGELIEVKHGFAFKSKHFAEEGELLVLTPGNFWDKGGFKLRPGKDRFYTHEFPDGFILCKGDVIVAMTEQGEGLLGSSAVIPKDNRFLHNQRLGRIHIQAPDKLDKGFAYFLFNTRPVRMQIRGSATGVKVKHTSPDRIKACVAKIPRDIAIQRRIASILSSYDNLIENNRRRIQLLEESARLLYKEWFVHLRFPGHEHTTITDGVPEGWERRPLFKEAAPTYGYAFKSKEFNENNTGIPVVRIRNIPDSKSSTFTTETAPSEKLLQDGDFLIGMDGEFHMNFWYGGKAWINQRVVRLSSQEKLNDAFIRYAVEKPIRDFNETISGTTVAHLGAKHLETITILVPAGDVLNQALSHFETIQQQLVVLHHQIFRAAEARDLLLPRLMSGEVAV